jgi:hypothetical protein
MKVLLRNRSGFEKIMDVPDARRGVIQMTQFNEVLSFSEALEAPMESRMNKVSYHQVGFTKFGNEEIPVYVEEFVEQLKNYRPVQPQ